MALIFENNGQLRCCLSKIFRTCENICTYLRRRCVIDFRLVKGCIRVSNITYHKQKQSTCYTYNFELVLSLALCRRSQRTKMVLSRIKWCFANLPQHFIDIVECKNLCPHTQHLPGSGYQEVPWSFLCRVHQEWDPINVRFLTRKTIRKSLTLESDCLHKELLLR